MPARRKKKSDKKSDVSPATRKRFEDALETQYAAHEKNQNASNTIGNRKKNRALWKTAFYEAYFHDQDQQNRTPEEQAQHDEDVASRLAFARGEGENPTKGLRNNLSDIAEQAVLIAGGKQTTTAVGATLANTLGEKDRIGDRQRYMPNKAAQAHLAQFGNQGHAFITEKLHAAFKMFGTWGRPGDANFVSTVGAADKLVEAAKRPTGKGIATLEDKLGIQPYGLWMRDCPTKSMWRYVVKDAKKFNLRVPTGRESGAFQDAWRAGGKTDGKAPSSDSPETGLANTAFGAEEAVIDSIPYKDLKQAESDGAVEMTKWSFPLTPDLTEDQKETKWALNPQVAELAGRHTEAKAAREAEKKKKANPEGKTDSPLDEEKKKKQNI